MKLQTTLVLLLALPAALPTVAAATPVVSLEMDGETYNAAGAILAPPTAIVSVTGEDGEAAAGAVVTLTILRELPLIGVVGNQVVVATTGDDGVARIPVPPASRLPGSYIVVAVALGERAEDRYTVSA